MADLMSQFPSLPPEVQEKILNGPAMSPPPGVVPNFDNPPNSTGVGIAFGVLCAVVAVVCFLFRVYCQTRVEKKWHAEDYFGLLAFISYLGAVISFFVFIYYGGFLVHQWNVRFRTFQKVLENSLVITFFYILLMLFAKVGILLEWNRIFNPSSDRNGFFWASHTILTLNVLLYISILIAEALSCRPAKHLWEPWVAGVCFNKRALDLASAYFNLVADFLILLLPQRIIWSLQMSQHKKLKVSLIFSAGIITCLCAIFRIVVIHPLKYAGDGDTNYLTSRIYMLTIAESTFVILVFCMPALPKGFVESAVGRGIIFSLHSLASMTRRSNTSWVESSHRETRTKGFDGIDSTSDLHMHDVENNMWSVSSHPGERPGEPGFIRRIDISTHHEQKSSAATASSASNPRQHSREANWR